MNNSVSETVKEGVDKLRKLNAKFLASLIEEQDVQISRNEFMECYK